jgi:hypothetical protein
MSEKKPKLLDGTASDVVVVWEFGLTAEEKFAADLATLRVMQISINRPASTRKKTRSMS